MAFLVQYVTNYPLVFFIPASEDVPVRVHLPCATMKKKWTTFCSIFYILYFVFCLLYIVYCTGYLQQKGVSGSTRTVYEEACSEMHKINR